MPAAEMVSHSSVLLDYVVSLKRRLSSCSSLWNDALLFFNWAGAVLTPYDLSSDGDVESGAKGKTMHPVMWYSLTYIIRQLFPVDGFLFALQSRKARVNNRSPNLPRQTRIYNTMYSDSFVDLHAVRFRYRLKSISYGQKHVPKLLHRLSRYKPTPQITGDQLSNYIHPPEPRGEDFRKWILVMETLFPNRSVYMKAAKVQRAAVSFASKDPGPKTGVLAPPRSRRPHTHLRYI